MADKITKDMIIGDILNVDRNLAPILMRAGMHCVGCPSAQGETLAEAGMVHGMNVDDIITEMNEYLEGTAN